jgi:hypothetical protein
MDEVVMKEDPPKRMTTLPPVGMEKGGKKYSQVKQVTQRSDWLGSPFWARFVKARRREENQKD